MYDPVSLKEYTIEGIKLHTKLQCINIYLPFLFLLLNIYIYLYRDIIKYNIVNQNKNKIFDTVLFFSPLFFYFGIQARRDVSIVKTTRVKMYLIKKINGLVIIFIDPDKDNKYLNYFKNIIDK